MSPDFHADVLAFHAKFRPHLIGATPKDVDIETCLFRMRLIREEIDETTAAMAEGDLPGIADGIVDSIYVLIGAAITYGIDVRPVWDAVHAANMRKTAAGPAPKVAKPPGWEPPDVAGVLARQGPLRGDLP